MKPAGSTMAFAEPDPLQPWFRGAEWENPVTRMRLRVEHPASASEGRATAWIAAYPPGSIEPPLHLHPRQTERFLVLAGTLLIRQRQSVREVGPNRELLIAPGEPHAVWNPHEQPAVVRWETAPALRTEQWMGMLIALARRGQVDHAGMPYLLQRSLLLHHFRHELRLARPAGWVQATVFPVLAALARLRGLHPDRMRDG